MPGFPEFTRHCGNYWRRKHVATTREDLELTVHRQIPENDDLRRQWNGLVLRMESPEVFYTYEWALAVQRGYGTSVKPLLLLGYEGAELVGVASLATSANERPVTFLAATTADYCDFVCAAERNLEFVELVQKALKKIAPDLVLASVPEASPTRLSVQRSAPEIGRNSFSRLAFRCSQVDLTSSAQRDEVRRLVSNKKLNRQIRLLSQNGPVKIRHCTAWAEVSPMLSQFRAAHMQRFREQGRTSNLEQPQRWRFIQELAQQLSEPGWMTLSFLLVGDKAVAWNYGFRFAGNWFWYQPTFDGNFRQYSPGLCLLAKIIEEACDSPSMERVDLGLGDEGYKERFATGFRDTTDITVSGSIVRHAREKLRYRTASAIKSHPQLEHCVRWLLSRPAPGGAGA